MDMNTHRNWILAAAVAGMPVIASAQQGPPTGVGFSVSALTAAILETDVDSGGTVASSRWYLEPGIVNRFDSGLAIGVAVGVGQTFYDIDGANGLTDSIDVNEVTVSVPIRFAVSDTAMAFIVPRFSYAGETGATVDKASTWGLLGSVAWRLSPTLTIGPGVGAFTTLYDDIQAFPFLFIDWAIAERISLSTGRGIAASRGPGLTLSYQATDDWALGVVARYENFEFRLDDRHPTSEGSISDRSVPVVATATWAPNPGINVVAFAGYSYGGNLELRDADGDKVGDSDYDPAPTFGVSARVRF